MEKHLSDSNTYKQAKFGDNEFVKVVEESNRMFKTLLSKKCISPEECKYFSYNFEKSSNLGNCIFCLKYTKDCMMYQVALSFLAVAQPQKKCENTWITT